MKVILNYLPLPNRKHLDVLVHMYTFVRAKNALAYYRQEIYVIQSSAENFLVAKNGSDT